MPPRKAKELARIRIAESVNGHDVYQDAFDFEQSKPQYSKRPRKEDESSKNTDEPVINVAMMLVAVKTNNPEEFMDHLLFRAIRGLTTLSNLAAKESK